MKTICVLLLAFVTLAGNAQDEFASTSFYNAVKRIQKEGETGFEQLKGNVLQNAYPEIKKEFRAKVLLPLADSGRIIVPTEGRPYAVYYFETEKKKEVINDRAVSLREALVKAHANPLYTRTITTTTGKDLHSDTYFFQDPDETHTSKAVFRTTVYRQKGRYHLSVEIR